MMKCRWRIVVSLGSMVVCLGAFDWRCTDVAPPSRRRWSRYAGLADMSGLEGVLALQMRALGSVALFVPGAKVGANEVAGTAWMVAVIPLLGIVYAPLQSGSGS